MKSVILSTAESKYRTVDLKDGAQFNGSGVSALTTDVYGQIAVAHNFPFMVYIFNNTSPSATTQPIPAQGDGDGNRNGDEIYAKGIRLRMQMENNAEKHNNTWKFWLVEWNTVQGNPCIPGDFFHVATGNNLLETIQQDRWKATLLGVYRTKARDIASTSKSDVFMNKWIPFRRKLCFRSDDSLVICKGMKEVYSIVGVCYDASNTAGGVGIGNIRINATLYYGDP